MSARRRTCRLALSPSVTASARLSRLAGQLETGTLLSTSDPALRAVTSAGFSTDPQCDTDHDAAYGTALAGLAADPDNARYFDSGELEANQLPSIYWIQIVPPAIAGAFDRETSGFGGW